MAIRNLFYSCSLLTSAVSLVGANGECDASDWITTTSTPAESMLTRGPPEAPSSSLFKGSPTSHPAPHDDAYSVSAPASVPSDLAAKAVDNTFHSWACPVHFWPDYAGNHSSPNIFSRTIVQIISDKLGGAIPHIRVGGTSGDRTYFIADQEEAILTVTGRNGIPQNVSIGPSFYEGFSNFPGAQYTYMTNLAHNDTGALENALTEAQQVFQAIGSDLESIEIGNEVDLYVKQGVRPADWGLSDYVQEWLSYAQNISQQVLEGNEDGIDTTNIFQALTYSTPFVTEDWAVQNAFDSGIDSNGNVKSISMHQYMTGRQAGLSLQDSFMDHGQIMANLSGFTPVLAYLAESHPSVPLYLAEVNSDVVTLDMDEYEGVFGSALWAIDYLLYAMSLGIPRVYMQQGTIFGFASWQPVAVDGAPPKIRPPFYGDLFIADAIGPAAADGPLHVLHIDLRSARLAAYALYAASRLARYAVVNLEAWNRTAAGARPVAPVRLAVPAGVASATVTWLSAAGADADEGITWGGQSWNYSATADGFVEVTGREERDTVWSRRGLVELEIDASQGALVELNYADS